MEAANQKISQANQRASKILSKSKEATEICNTQREYIKKLREELEVTKEKVNAANAELVVLREEVMSATASRGLFLALFPRTTSLCVFPQSVTDHAIAFQKEWRQIYPTFSLTSGHSGDHAYGEPSLGTIGRVCHVIKCELEALRRPLSSSDSLLDWGAGAGKWLLFAPRFLAVPKMFTIGIECEYAIFDMCRKNIHQAQRLFKHSPTAKVIFAKSQSFTSFCPVRVVVNYDGGTQKALKNSKSRTHQTIMRTVFCSATVDVVVSSRLDMNTFHRYFGAHIEKLSGSLWKCVVCPACYFGGSKFNVNVWFRLTPMRCSSTFDHNFQLHYNAGYIL